MVQLCPPCVLILHDECYNNHNHCDCFSDGNYSNVIDRENKRGGPTKDDDAVTDPGSTGRKRAAVMYPITEGMICEWAGLKNAGGGKHPIVGCLNNLATNRHHGPDKNTLNNTEGNVHRICATCHNRYHAVTDNDYDPNGPFTPHDSETKTTLEEIYNNEMHWTLKKVKRIRD